MGILLNVYNDMVKQAEEAVVAEQIDLLAKYASAASELLQAEFPNNYTKEDVTELADKLIERDIAIATETEKTAEAIAITEEYVKVAEQLLIQEHGNDFSKEAVALLADTMMGMDAEAEFNKEAEAIKAQGFLDEFNKLAGTSFESIEELDETIKQSSVADEVAPVVNKVKGAVQSAASAVKDKAGVVKDTAVNAYGRARNVVSTPGSDSVSAPLLALKAKMQAKGAISNAAHAIGNEVSNIGRNLSGADVKGLLANRRSFYDRGLVEQAIKSRNMTRGVVGGLAALGLAGAGAGIYAHSKKQGE